MDHFCKIAQEYLQITEKEWNYLEKKNKIEMI